MGMEQIQQRSVSREIVKNERGGLPASVADPAHSSKKQTASEELSPSSTAQQNRPSGRFCCAFGECPSVSLVACFFDGRAAMAAKDDRPPRWLFLISLEARLF